MSSVWAFISLFVASKARCCCNFLILFLRSCAPRLNHPLFLVGNGSSDCALNMKIPSSMSAEYPKGVGWEEVPSSLGELDS
ncbi:hypothetical protein HanIR_Chr13g0646271 [Helianthus annuus]|nr:hypothetical protein HanIR_Chr13g0646271 [Helianthus annuus]